MRLGVTVAGKMLDTICADYSAHNKDIMQGTEGERIHALDVLAWVQRLKQSPALSLRLAALFHDIDRVVTAKKGAGFKGDRRSKAYLLHKKRHARRSARFIIPLLERQGFPQRVLHRTRFLILHHDDTGREVDKLRDSDLNCLVAADTFAFFTSIAPALFVAEGESRTGDKIRFMVDKLPERARRLLSKRQLDNPTFNKLKDEIIREYSRGASRNRQRSTKKGGGRKSAGVR
ncbi:MAG TPA: HD domain-containing protein [Terriglobia bacterium]|nr:HD domain-containing protein [Terriglobia bacterium]